MKHVFHLNEKEGEVQNLHLTQTNYYNQRFLHAFISQVRIINSHNLPHFGIVGTGTSYDRRIMSSIQQHSTSAGISSSHTTLIRKLTPLNEKFDSNIRVLLSNKIKFVAAMGNNQKGNNALPTSFLKLLED